VVYESMFGNTKQIARAVADGLRESVEVQLAAVSDAPLAPDSYVALTVAGGCARALRTCRRGPLRPPFVDLWWETDA
jgi:menaquinone-dependent protoporphyrinogen IX oxidase